MQNEFIPYRDKYSKLEEDYSKVNTREAENPFVDASISDLVKNRTDIFQTTERSSPGSESKVLYIRAK